MLPFIALFLIGFLFLLWSTPRGIGIQHDSVFYLTAANNLISGRGLSWIGDGGVVKPLIHFPPLYPLALSSLIALGLTAETAARLMAAILFGANIALSGLLVASITRHTTIGILASLLALITPAMLETHLIALSEPPFIFISLAFIAYLTRHLTKPTWHTLLLVAILASAGALTRYAGMALLATGGFCLLFLQRRSLRARLRDLALFSLAALLPILLWLYRNFTLTGSLTNRTFRFHPPGKGLLKALLEVVPAWIIPTDLPLPLTIALIFALALGIGYLLQQRLRSPAPARDARRTLLVVLIAFQVVYLSLLIFSITFFDAATPLDNRTLLPFLITLLILVVGLGWRFAAEGKGRLARLLLLGLLTLFVWNSWMLSSALLQRSREKGIGFASQQWRASETLAWVSRLPEGALIYTNERLALTYLSGRPAFSIPEKIDTVRAEPRAGFAAEMALMHERLRGENAYLVLFHPYNLRWEMPTRDEITFPLARLVEFEDASVYINPVNLK